MVSYKLVEDLLTAKNLRKDLDIFMVAFIRNSSMFLLSVMVEGIL